MSWLTPLNVALAGLVIIVLAVLLFWAICYFNVFYKSHGYGEIAFLVHITVPMVVVALLCWLIAGIWRLWQALS